LNRGILNEPLKMKACENRGDRYYYERFNRHLRELLLISAFRNEVCWRIKAFIADIKVVAMAEFF
jgi:hypothetical protein